MALGGDADQALFYFNNTTTATSFGPAGVGTLATNANWQAIYSIAGTDVAVDSAIPVVASTRYRCVIAIDSARVPYFYINDALVATGTALTSLTTLLFYIGIQADGAAAAKAVSVSPNLLLSQLIV